MLFFAGRIETALTTQYRYLHARTSYTTRQSYTIYYMDNGSVNTLFRILLYSTAIL